MTTRTAMHDLLPTLHEIRERLDRCRDLLDVPVQPVESVTTSRPTATEATAMDQLRRLRAAREV